MSSKSEKSTVLVTDPYNRPERFEWLISQFDKYLVRFQEGRQSLNRKATWTLATATGFAVFSGLTRGPSIVASLGEGVTNYKVFVFVVSILFVSAYLALLGEVLKVYRPQSVGYPVSPFNFEVTGPIDRRQVDSGDFAKKSWQELFERFIKPEQEEIHHNLFRNYIDELAETYLLHEDMSHHLSNAYRLLPVLAILSFVLFLLA